MEEQQHMAGKISPNNAKRNLHTAIKLGEVLASKFTTKQHKSLMQ